MNCLHAQDKEQADFNKVFGVHHGVSYQLVTIVSPFDASHPGGLNLARVYHVTGMWCRHRSIASLDYPSSIDPKSCHHLNFGAGEWS